MPTQSSQSLDLAELLVRIQDLVAGTKRILDEIRSEREGHPRPRLTLVHDERAEVKDGV
jgi:hypothetical protein